MPRKSRKSLNSNYFHVIVQGIEKSYIFQKNKFKKMYKELLVEKSIEYGITLIAYCIMDNHAHMLIYTEDIKVLSKCMQSINVSFANYYNKSQKRVGYVFRNRYKSVPIQNEKHLYKTLAYIHLNPVNAGICLSPDLYKYSSYNDYLNKNIILNKEILKLLKFTGKDYINIFKFLHYIPIIGEEYSENLNYREKEKIIEEYIKEHNIKDIFFQADKVEIMINDLKKRGISFSTISQFLGISNTKLKHIIFE